MELVVDRAGLSKIPTNAPIDGCCAHDVHVLCTNLPITVMSHTSERLDPKFETRSSQRFLPQGPQGCAVCTVHVQRSEHRETGGYIRSLCVIDLSWTDFIPSRTSRRALSILLTQADKYWIFMDLQWTTWQNGDDKAATITACAWCIFDM